MRKVREKEESYEKNEESCEKNEESLRKHEEGYEAEKIQVCRYAKFPITFLTFL